MKLSNTASVESLGKVAYLQANIKFIPVSSVNCSPKTQQRIGLNLETVAEYKEAISLGVKFPPIKVRFDGENYWLWDGFHTTKAYEELGIEQIEAKITPGTLRDAILDSVGANAEHGLRRSREDKRKAVEALLYDEEWMEWSNREIARRCKVSYQLVNNMRKELCNQNGDNKIITDNVVSDNLKKYKNKYGNVSVMDTKNIGQTSNTGNDDKIITSFKRGDNPKENKSNTNLEFNKVEITSNYRQGEEGTITQRPNLNSAIIEFADGTREVFQDWDYQQVEDNRLDNLINQASQKFEPNPVKINQGDIVIVNSHKVDDRLVGYSRRYAKVISVNDYTASIQIWGKKIDSVALADLQPLTDDFASMGVSIIPEDLGFLMDNFDGLEAVISHVVRMMKSKQGFKAIFEVGTKN